MANITTQEPIKWNIDQAVSDLSGLISVPGGLDCAAATSVTGLVVSGTEPAGTTRKAGFTVDGDFYKLDSDGSLIPITSVEDEGNTADELAEISSIPGFAGKSVGVTVYLYAEDPEGAMPTFGIKAIGVSSQQQTIKTELSPVYNLGSGAKIIKLEAKTTVSGDGTAVVEASIDEGPWGALSSFAGVPASTVQFRATLTAPTIGVSSAKVESATLQYRTGDNLVSGAGVAEIVSVTDNWHIGVRQCRMTVNHKRLADSLMKAYVSFRDTPLVVSGELIGTGTSETKAYSLAHPLGVKYDSVMVYFDSQRVYDGFEVNTAVGRVTCAAPVGASITVDYEYGWASEEWREMSLNRTVPTLEYDQSEFKYSLPLNEDAKSICAVKIALEVTEGHTDDEVMGTGSGATRTYRLSRAAKVGQIAVYAGGVALPATAWALSTDGRSVIAAANAGAVLTADYDWISETPEVYQFISVFAE
jgi:hypothetical protein